MGAVSNDEQNNNELKRNVLEERLAFVYRCVLIIICAWCLLLNLFTQDGKFDTGMLIFFTIISNILCFIFIIIIVINSIITSSNKELNKIEGKTKVLTRVRGAVTLMITVTFLIYHFVLIPQATAVGSAFDFFGLPNVLAHYVVPIMMILDWLLFEKKNSYRPYDPLLWLIFPIVYFVIILIRGYFGGIIKMIGSKYPYFFIDVDALGMNQVWINAGFASLFFLLIGYLIFFVDRFRIADGNLYFGKRQLTALGNK